MTLGVAGLLLTACQPEPEPPRYVLGMTLEADTPTVVVVPCPVEEGYGYGHDLEVFLASTTVKEERAAWSIESEVPTWELEEGATLPSRIPIGSAPEGYAVTVDRLPLDPDLRYTAKTGYDDRSVDFVASKLEAGRIWDGEQFVSEDDLRGDCGLDEDWLGDAIIVLFVGLILVVVLGALTLVLGALLLPTAAVVRVQRRRRAQVVVPALHPSGEPTASPPRWPPTEALAPRAAPSSTRPPVHHGPQPTGRDSLPPPPPTLPPRPDARRLTRGQGVLVVAGNLLLFVPLRWWGAMAESGTSEAAPALLTVGGVQALLLLVDSFAERNAGRRGRSVGSWVLGTMAAVPAWAMLSGTWLTPLSGSVMFAIAMTPLGVFWWWRLHAPVASGSSRPSTS